jgi:hypothetical protein
MRQREAQCLPRSALQPRLDRVKAMLIVSALSMLILLGLASVAHAATISGKVALQGSEEGVAGVSVTVNESGTGNAVAVPIETGSTGAYEVQVPAGTYDVSFTAPLGSGYKTALDRGEVVTANRTVNVALASGNDVIFSGVLLGDGATPVAAATVRLAGSRSDEVTTDANGAFSMTVPPGSYELSVEGFRQTGFSHTVVPSYFQFSNASLTLSASLHENLALPLHALTVRTLGPGEGSGPVSGVMFDEAVGRESFEVAAPLGPGIMARDVDVNEEETTDVNGYATLSVPDLESSQAEIDAIPSREAELARTPVVASGVADDHQVREVHLERGIAFSGKLVAEHEAPVPGATIGLGRELVTTAADGSFSMRILPGTYSFVVEGSRQPGVAHDVIPSSFSLLGGSVTLTVSTSETLVLPFHALTVRTLGAVGTVGSTTPMPGVQFDEGVHQNELGKAATLAPGMSVKYANVGEEETTDANGLATLVVPDYEGSSAPIDAAPPEETGLARTMVLVEKVSEDQLRAVHLNAGVKFSGSLLDGRGMPVGGATIRLESLIPLNETLTTAADGSFSAVVQSGNYLLSVEGVRPPGVSHADLPASFSFSEAEVKLTKSFNETLVLPLHALTVRVVGAADSPIPGVRFDESISQRNLGALQPLAPGVAVRSASVFEEETTNAGGEALLSTPDYEGSEARISAVPPATTQLPRSLLRMGGITQDQTQVVAYGKSSTDASAPEVQCAAAPAGWSSQNVTIACTAVDTGSGLAHPEDASFSLTTSVSEGSEAASAFTNTHSVCDRSDNCVQAGPIGPIEVDRKPPTIEIAEPLTGASVEQGASLTAGYVCTDGGSGVSMCEGTIASGAALDTSSVGQHVLEVTSTDAAGNRSTAELVYTVLPDEKPPTVECEAADSAWHGANTTVHCAASDTGSGLAIPADASFGLTTGVHLESESTSAYTNALEVCDLAGNCSKGGPIGPFRIDRKAPTVSTTSPEEGEVVAQGASLLAGYSCADSGSGIASCEGSTSSGSPLPTLAPGQYTLSVVAVDAVGNTTSRTVHYTVVEAGRPPEIGRCEKLAGETRGKKLVYEGAFTSATCVLASETNTGKYEWNPGVLSRRFTTAIKGTTKVALETVRGTRITCTGETGAGEYLGLTQVRNVVFAFTGCEMPSVKAACASGSAATGEIVSQPLEGALGVFAPGATSATNKIGLALRPVATAGTAITFTCAGDVFVIRGAVVVPVTTDKMLTANTWKATESKGKQKPEGLLGEPSAVLEASLNGGAPEQAGLSLIAVQTSEEPAEINTVY